ncbi:MAG: thioredoxin domain-containing protein [Desulfobacteraceae bacterium]
MVPVLEQVLEQYPRQVKIAFKHFPLRNHAFAYKAAQATVAAQQQGKFWPFHDMLFRQFKKINDQRIEEISRILELDASRFKQEMNSEKTKARINADIAEGRDAGVRGTPTVFINGQVLRNKTLSGFKQAIINALRP